MADYKMCSTLADAIKKSKHLNPAKFKSGGLEQKGYE